MKKNIFKQLSERFMSKAALAVSGGMILMSCGAHVGGYSETDGVYYDPETDTLPEGVVVQNGNRVGEYYDYNDNSVIANSRQHQYEQDNRYSQWNTNDSDWGAYAGEETNLYSNYWGGYWGGPWGYYSPYWGSGLRIGMNWGWGYGSWFGYNPYMSWGWGGYHPYMFGYSPYWGMYSPYGYSPYYYGYSPYYYGAGYYPFRYQRSGTVGRGFNSYMNNGTPFQNKVGVTNGFRNGVVNARVQQARGFSNPTQSASQNTGITPRRSYRNPNTGIQQQQQQQTRPRAIPRYDNGIQQQQQRPSNNGFRNDSGFRGNSGGFNSGSSGGGMRGGSSGSRSGGFR